MEEIRQTVQSPKNGAPSPDSVQYGHLREADNKVVKQMTENYNQVLKTGVILDE